MHKRSIPPTIVALVAAAGGFGSGFAVGDDAKRVASLEERVDEVRTERDRESARADDLADQLNGQDEDIVRLQDELASAEAKAAAGPSEGDASSSNNGLRRHRIGESAKAGQYELRPTGFTRQFVSGDTATYQVVVAVTNHSDDSITPFCGDEGAAVIDTRGRTFDPESVIDGSSSNCDDVQPGLTVEDYKLAFKLPASAKARTLRLWGSYDNEATPQLWSVK